ncbi:MAG: hypothetical protein ABSH33_00185 [Steroidobacteraceae bacterium]
MPISMKLGSIAGGVLTCALLASNMAYGDAAATPEAGVWQRHEYSFAFMGFTSTYSCDGLANQLKLLLIAAGARPDVKAQAGACASGFGRPDKFARADLTFYTLAPAAAAKPGDGAPVDGSWIPVALAYQRPRTLGRGDCELVEQFRTSVLPMFTTRNVENHTTCVPHQESGSDIDLKFDSFGVPPKAHSAKPATGS